MSTAMMPRTTSSSISVNPTVRRVGVAGISCPSCGSAPQLQVVGPGAGGLHDLEGQPGRLHGAVAGMDQGAAPARAAGVDRLAGHEHDLVPPGRCPVAAAGEDLVIAFLVD